MSTSKHGEKTRLSKSDRVTARHAGYAHPPDVAMGCPARIRDQPVYSLALGRGATGRDRLALPGTPSSRDAGLGELRVEADRKQPARQVLLPDGCWQETVIVRAGPLGANCQRHRGNYESCARGGTAMSLWGWLFHRRQREADLEEEIQAHLRMAAQERMGQGEAAEQARTSAVREFGNVALVKEVT